VDAREVTAKCLGVGAQVAAHGLPVGPVVEAVVLDILGVQDEQSQVLEEISRDVQQLLTKDRRAGRELLERAAIPGRTAESVTRDLRTAADEFARAAAAARENSFEQATIHFDAALLQLLLGDVPAAGFYVKKSWSEGYRCFRHQISFADECLRYKRLGLKVRGAPDPVRELDALMYGRGAAGHVRGLPEADALMLAHRVGRQLNEVRDAWSVLNDGESTTPLCYVDALITGENASAVVVHAYPLELLAALSPQMREVASHLGIHDRLYASPDDRWEGNSRCVSFEVTSGRDDRVRQFKQTLTQLVPAGLLVGLSNAECAKLGVKEDRRPLW